ncbi:MAG: hypothetical protein IPM50_11870 [Acidobacteriota bacterium]|nr:MAG: hypothetical protein IPM50_11870 [Acidobacteriota bacterium]
MTRRICFLSMDDLAGYVSDDDLAVPHLAELSIRTDILSWRQTAVAWRAFDAVIIRTPWDYQKYPQEFLAALEDIESQTTLHNSLKIVRWNLDKTYLRDLSDKGVRIVPTLWHQSYDFASFAHWLDELATDEVIIKPTISATAAYTYRLREFDASLASIFGEREFLVQPFVSSILDEGEYSLFYFNGEYSHAIVKRPKPADFRVQEEHGGIITEIDADDTMRAAAANVLEHIDEDLLYARVDLVLDAEGQFALMELELIEPSLYLRMNAEAPARFAAAIAAR